MIKDTRVVKDAVYLIDDKTMTSRGYAQSGWDFDDRGRKTARGEEIRGIYLCSDETGDFDPYLSRRFVPVKTGKAGFFHSFRLRYGEDFYLRFLSDDKKEAVALEISAKDGLFCVGDNEHFVGQRAFHTVECGDLFTLIGAAHRDFAAF